MDIKVNCPNCKKKDVAVHILNKKYYMCLKCGCNWNEDHRDQFITLKESRDNWIERY